MLIQNVEQFLVIDEENQSAYLDLRNGGYWWYWYGWCRSDWRPCGLAWWSDSELLLLLLLRCSLACAAERRITYAGWHALLSSTTAEHRRHGRSWPTDADLRASIGSEAHALLNLLHLALELFHRIVTGTSSGVAVLPRTARSMGGGHGGRAGLGRQQWREAAIVLSCYLASYLVALSTKLGGVRRARAGCVWTENVVEQLAHASGSVAPVEFAGE